MNIYVRIQAYTLIIDEISIKENEKLQVKYILVLCWFQ